MTASAKATRAAQPGVDRRRLRRIAPGVVWFGSGRWATEANVYFVVGNDDWVLIDTAWRQRGPLIRQVAATLFGADRPPAAILLTHIHPDHSGAAFDLARWWDVPVYALPEELPLLAGDLSRTGPLDRWLFAPLMRAVPRLRTAMIAANQHLAAVVRPLDPRAPVPFLPDWRCVPTPGHTPGHVAYFRPDDRVAITGDALVTLNLNAVWDFIRGRQRLSAPPWITTWDWARAKRSIATLADLEPRVLAGGHGVPMTGPHTARRVHAFAARLANQPRSAP